MPSISLSTLIACVVTGIGAGVASGLFGVGGGIVLVPILVFWFGYSQQTANGTSLVALLLPVGSFAVWNYWRNQKINSEHITVGLIIGLGIAVGAYLGSYLAVGMNDDILKRVFAIFLAIVSIKLWMSA